MKSPISKSTDTRPNKKKILKIKQSTYHVKVVSWSVIHARSYRFIGTRVNCMKCLQVSLFGRCIAYFSIYFQNALIVTFWWWGTNERTRTFEVRHWPSLTSMKKMIERRLLYGHELNCGITLLPITSMDMASTNLR